MVRSLVPWTDLPRPLGELRREMDTLIDRFLRADGTPLAEAADTFAPRMNVAETENDYEVTVELPGLKPEDFNVEYRDGQLWISGEKHLESEEQGKAWHRIERSYGRFQRVLTFPSAVNDEQIRAEYDHGVLRLTIPKAEAAKPRKIAVKS